MSQPNKKYSLNFPSFYPLYQHFILKWYGEKIVNNATAQQVNTIKSFKILI